MRRNNNLNSYINRYDFEFDFLPNVLPALYQKDQIDDYVMTHPFEWKKILIKMGVRSDFGIEKIMVEKEVSEDKNIKFIFTFPKPKVVPECFYALLIFDTNKDWNYYTLELDFGSSIVFKEGGGVICGQRGSSHLNYGRRCKDDVKEFVGRVQDIIDGKPEEPGALLKDFDYAEAGKLVGLTPEQMKEKCIIC